MNTATAPRHTWIRRCRALVLVAVCALVAPSLVALAPGVAAIEVTEAASPDAETQIHAARRNASHIEVGVAVPRLPSDQAAGDLAQPVDGPPSAHDAWRLHDRPHRGPPTLRGPPLRR